MTDNANKRREVRCVVMCRDANGAPDLAPFVVSVTRQEYDDGHHYELAEEAAKAARYQWPYFTCDENDPAGKRLLNLFDWSTAKRISSADDEE